MLRRGLSSFRPALDPLLQTAVQNKKNNAARTNVTAAVTSTAMRTVLLLFFPLSGSILGPEVRPPEEFSLRLRGGGDSRGKNSSCGEGAGFGVETGERARSGAGAGLGIRDPTAGAGAGASAML
jgi:hypothetical protein